MVMFNIIHPAAYLVTDPAAPKENSIATNQIGISKMPVVPAEIAKRDHPVDDIELV
jgi:hypothetical protein